MMTDEYDIGPNGNFHGEYDAINNVHLFLTMTPNVFIR